MFKDLIYELFHDGGPIDVVNPHIVKSYFQYTEIYAVNNHWSFNNNYILCSFGMSKKPEKENGPKILNVHSMSNLRRL